MSTIPGIAPVTARALNRTGKSSPVPQKNRWEGSLAGEVIRPRHARSGKCRFTSCEQCQFPPFPETIHIRKTDLSQPAELRLDIQQFVGRIFLLGRDAQCLKKATVQPDSW